MTKLRNAIRKYLGTDSVVESLRRAEDVGYANEAASKRILDEQLRLRMLIAEHFVQKSPISFEQMDAIMQETRDRLDVAVLSVCRIEDGLKRLGR